VALHKPRPLDPADRLEEFDCGDPGLDGWLARFARMAHGGNTARVYVTVDDNRRVIGYYAAAAGQVQRSDLPERMRQGAPSAVAIAILARLAVDRRHQGEGLGLALLSDALRRVLDAADILGIRALIVHAANEPAAGFYRAAGFTPSPTDPLHLAVLVKDLARRYG
jgi:GNAT superfamily N-acetyltransferase